MAINPANQAFEDIRDKEKAEDANRPIPGEVVIPKPIPKPEPVPEPKPEPKPEIKKNLVPECNSNQAIDIGTPTKESVIQLASDGQEYPYEITRFNIKKAYICGASLVDGTISNAAFSALPSTKEGDVVKYNAQNDVLTLNGGDGLALKFTDLELDEIDIKSLFSNAESNLIKLHFEELIIEKVTTKHLNLKKTTTSDSQAAFDLSVDNADSTVKLNNVYVLIPNLKNINTDAVADNHIESTNWDIAVIKAKGEYQPEFKIRIKETEGNRLYYLVFPDYIFSTPGVKQTTFYNSEITTPATTAHTLAQENQGHKTVASFCIKNGVVVPINQYVSDSNHADSLC